MIDEDDEKIVLDCTCGSAHHQLTAKLYRWAKNDTDFYIYFQLKQWGNVFRRIKMAAKYLIGAEAPHGHWDSTLLQNQDAKKLHALLGKYLDEVDPKVETLETVEEELKGIGPRMQYLIKKKVELSQKKISDVIEKKLEG